MKLVEILARELKEWPEGAAFIVQDHDGECWPSTSNRTPTIDDGLWATDDIYGAKIHSSVAHDYATSIVTRDQWEAERERILAESSKFTEADKEHIADLTAIACDKRSKEDQALWDKVAISQMQALTVDGSYDFVRDYSDMYEESDMRKVIAATACDFADAFMAERSKRLDNSHTTNSTS